VCTTWYFHFRRGYQRLSVKGTARSRHLLLEVYLVILQCLGVAVFLAAPIVLSAQPTCRTKHLTIFDANLAEFLEERTVELQSGPNSVEWRNLVPQALIRTIRVTSGEGVRVVRQDVTFDGAEVRGQKSPVLHLTLQNTAAAGPYKVQIDYLAPGLSWKGDYAMLLNPSRANAAPSEMQLDGWLTVHNDTGTDVCAAAVDLVAGEVQLRLSGGMARTFTANSQMANVSDAGPASVSSAAQVTGLSVFSRVRLGSNIAMAANVTIGRFPLVQALKLPVEERHIFENEAGAQTLGRGGFMLAPRGLEVRLVSRNQFHSPLPAGVVTVYSQEDQVAQVAGQDEIPLTPVGADFSVTQGRSNVLQGTRRVLDRRTVPDPAAPNRNKLVTQVETVIANRGGRTVTAFVRDGIESYGRDWTVTESTHSHQKIGDRMLEFRLPVPANSSVSLVYTVESR